MKRVPGEAKIWRTWRSSGGKSLPMSVSFSKRFAKGFIGSGCFRHLPGGGRGIPWTREPVGNSGQAANPYRTPPHGSPRLMKSPTSERAMGIPCHGLTMFRPSAGEAEWLAGGAGDAFFDIGGGGRVS